MPKAIYPYSNYSRFVSRRDDYLTVTKLWLVKITSFEADKIAKYSHLLILILIPFFS